MEQVLEYIINNKLDTLGAILGFVYLFLEFRTSAWMWVVGCVMPAVYIVVLYQSGIYADCGMEVYYILAGIYGLAVWLRGGKDGKKKIEISKTPPRVWLYLAVIFIILDASLSVFLIKCTDSKVPYTDAFTTALSIIGMWMLSRKYLEQWWVWFVVDLVSTCLYIYKGVYGRSILYGVYTVMAVYGYYLWRRKRSNLDSLRSTKS